MHSKWCTADYYYFFFFVLKCVYRGSLLCRAWHHDNKVRWWVLIPDGEFRTHSCLPLLLDKHHNTEAFIIGHHCPQLWKICLYAFLPRVQPTGDYQQMPGCCLYLYVRIKTATLFTAKVTLVIIKLLINNITAYKYSSAWNFVKPLGFSVFA